MAHSIATLVEILEQDDHYLHLDCKPQIDMFLEKAHSLRDILRNPCLIPLNLETRMIDAAHEAEDLIEVHIMNQILPMYNQDHELHLEDIVQEFDSIKDEMLKIVDDTAMKPFLPINHSPSQVTSMPELDPCTRNNVAVYNEDFRYLKERIVEGPSKLQTIFINGMPGMGKRTLARRLYNDALIASSFYRRAWVSAPVTSNEKVCLLNLMDGLGILTNEMYRKDVYQLKVHIQDALKKIKFFIVIYDVVDKENWFTFIRLFRDYRVGARLLFTTCDINEETLSAYGELYQVRFLTNSESWLLLRQKVFGREHCAKEFEPFGNKIIGLCRGIPQALGLIAGFLATSEKTPATWEISTAALSFVLEDVDLDGIQAKVFQMIYYYLPYFLRPCLLYVGALAESCDIQASKITKLWMAEGFVEQSASKCSEDVAHMYLKILINKNLLSLTQEEPNGRIKSFQVQLSLRGFYWVIASFEKFVRSDVLDDRLNISEGDIKRHVSARQLFQPSNGMELPSLARSFLSARGVPLRHVSINLKLRLLKILDVFQSEFYQFPTEILQLVLLRYLAFSCRSNLPPSFSKFRNLQTLIIRRLPVFRAFSLPSDLWELTQLRHVICKETFTWYYPRNGEKVVQGKLHTLSNMQLFGVENHFLEKIPNIRKLGIFCNIAMETVFDLACLDKLETVKCSSDWSLASRNFLSYLTLPRSLRKLTLSLCRITSKFMKVVGSLPNLELLKIQKTDFVQSPPEWDTAEGEFPHLVSLEMLDLNLVHWKAKATQFPRIKHLNIQNCYALVEIPLDFGKIQSLELIQVNKASPSALISAMEIKKEQEGRGNKFLQVRTHKVV